MKHRLLAGLVQRFALSDGSRFIITKNFDGTYKIECLNGEYFFQNTYLLGDQAHIKLLKICREIKSEASKKQ